MFDFFIELYSTKKRNKILDRLHFYFFKRKIAIFFFKCLNITIFNGDKNVKMGIDPKSDIIVSLTSFPARISTLWITIDSIMNQTIKPKKIILWLSSEQFKNGLADLPSKILLRQKRGLEICFVNGDIGSHKKYYYSFLQFTCDYIVTIDDDFIYHSHLLEQLYKVSKEFNNAVVCNYARFIRKDKKGRLTPYNSWKLVNERGNKPVLSSCIFFGSGGGTLFPPGTLYKDCTNLDLFMKLTPKADDIWLNAMCRLQGSTIVYLNSKYDLFPLFIKNNVKLADLNLDANYNDEQLKKINEYYRNLIAW